MTFSGHQLLGTFADWLRNLTPHKTMMVQKELQQAQIRFAKSSSQKKVVAQPRV
jgi:hypothetical protein